MRAKLYLFFIIVVLLLAGVFGCSPKVHVDRDESTNMTMFHSYKFVDGGSDTIENKNFNPLYKSSLVDKALHDEIEKQLNSRGLIKKNKSPEMLVAYHTYAQEKEGAGNAHYPMMYGGLGWQYYPWGANQQIGYWDGYNNAAFQYTEGTLIVDIINAKTKVLVWRGSVSDAVTNPEDLHNKATAAVKQIFKKFPLKEKVKDKK